jgi:hypothetical protein
MHLISNDWLIKLGYLNNLCMSPNLLQECKHCWQHYLEGPASILCREGPILRAQVFSVLLTAHPLTLATLVPRHRLRERRRQCLEKSRLVGSRHVRNLILD